ncbi:hypothetical protein L873DRAFT_867830 [Choiromyces venosus 120613-1]|uniref:Uncharacterized protein n=1 Tax=Choiromyces venosus 120613-1 TaxID=1336337 RepID=A0A3N4JSB7_9PEZI|nr:hypothetical protein L873DRAFT_867830 [Choiromyces venosus 120613-1]
MFNDHIDKGTAFMYWAPLIRVLSTTVPPPHAILQNTTSESIPAFMLSPQKVIKPRD